MAGRPEQDRARWCHGRKSSKLAGFVAFRPTGYGGTNQRHREIEKETAMSARWLTRVQGKWTVGPFTLDFGV